LAQATKLQRKRCIFTDFFKIMRRFRNSCFQGITEMPIYEYRCQSCGHEFETIQKIADAPLTTCPACAQETLRKKVSAAGFRLKGGGWYETDFKAGKKRNVAGESGGADSGSKEAGAKESSGNGTVKSGESAARGGESSAKGGDSAPKSGDGGKSASGNAAPAKSGD
jgi:putative FmdB family regulatory protein